MYTDYIILSGIGLVILLLILNVVRSRQHFSQDSSGLVPIVNELRKEIQQSIDRQRKEVQSSISNMDDKLVKSIFESSSSLQKHFGSTSKLITDVTERLTKLDATNKQVLGFSEQLQSLENILKNPKQRGILGEYWLETLLGQVLQPNQYKMQYDLGIQEETGNKLIPDAVIFVKDLIIPIDAKFSLENYNKIQKENDPIRRDVLEKEFKSDVKKRIDETSKYIIPERGTTNFAFMFVPAEGVYHNLITSSVGAVNVNTRNLIEYAFEKKVMIISPTSFFAYLQTVLLGLKALQIEESVKDIQKQAELLMRHMKGYEEYHNKLGKHLETTYRAYSDSNIELKKIDKDIFRITEGSAGKELEPIDIEHPQID
ncbi:MAG: DNA recombination protein RmuC [Patescibacteria group bacterium]